jgi:ribosomal protein L37E
MTTTPITIGDFLNCTDSDRRRLAATLTRDRAIALVVAATSTIDDARNYGELPALCSRCGRRAIRKGYLCANCGHDPSADPKDRPKDGGCNCNGCVAHWGAVDSRVPADLCGGRGWVQPEEWGAPGRDWKLTGLARPAYAPPCPGCKKCLTT